MFISIILILGLALPVAAQEEPIDPSSVAEDMAPGESITVDKTVTMPEIPPKPDVYFLADTTGSMGPVIAAVSGNATVIMNAISTSDPTAQFGVGNYKDFPRDTYAFQHQLGITSVTADVAADIGAWSATGGYDGSEGQFYALTRIADPSDPEGIGWRGGSSKIVVWFGDAPAHDPVPIAATGLGYDITEATVTADLVAAGIRVIAIGWTSGTYYPNALDDDPRKSAGDYLPPPPGYPGYVIGGSSGQASRIAAATGGVYLSAATPGDVVDAIMDGLEAIKTDVWGEVEADEGLTVTLDPLVHEDVLSGTSVSFEETITVAEDAEQCTTLSATVIFYANSHPDEGAEIGRQAISIKVEDIGPPTVSCVEAVNPHGNNVPGEKRPDKAKDKAENPDGFCQIFAEDNCDDPEDIEIWVGTTCGEKLFGPFQSGTVIKFTEAPGATPSQKKIGSTKGQADAVAYHITLPSEPIITAWDAAGLQSVCTSCLVPPPPK